MAKKRASVVDQSAQSIVRYKIISMGEGGCGKSCLIKRYCEGKFVERYISTIGIDFGVKPVTVQGTEVRVNFFDFSGHPEFFDVRNEFYKDTQGAVLVYDVSSRSSFNALDSWLAEAAKFGAADIPVVLCGNKIDKPRIVTEQEARDWADSHGFSYFESSANSGANVDELFVALFDKIASK